MDKRYKPEEVRKRVIDIFKPRPQKQTGASVLASLRGMGKAKTNPPSSSLLRK